MKNTNNNTTTLLFAEKIELLLVQQQIEGYYSFDLFVLHNHIGEQKMKSLVCTHIYVSNNIRPNVFLVVMN